jgi:hypothetical protein
VIKFVVHRIDSPIQARLVEALVARAARYVARPEMLELGTETQIIADDNTRDSGARLHRADVSLRIIESGEIVARLLVEADGAAFHNAVADAARDARLLEQGWPTVRFTGSQINRDAHACADQALAKLDELVEKRSEAAHQKARQPASREFVAQLWADLLAKDPEMAARAAKRAAEEERIKKARGW